MSPQRFFRWSGIILWMLVVGAVSGVLAFQCGVRYASRHFVGHSDRPTSFQRSSEP